MRVHREGNSLSLQGSGGNPAAPSSALSGASKARSQKISRCSGSGPGGAADVASHGQVRRQQRIQRNEMTVESAARARQTGCLRFGPTVSDHIART